MIGSREPKKKWKKERLRGNLEKKQKIPRMDLKTFNETHFFD